MLIVLLVFLRAVAFDFVTLDDGGYVYENPYVRQGLTPQGLDWAFRSAHFNYWIPFSWLSFMLDAALFGPGPAGFHFTNIVLHATNAGLLFLFLARATQRPCASLFVACVFAFHPTRLEAVAWVTSRKDVLSSAFGLLALLCYLRWVRRRSWIAYGGVCLAMIGSLLSKSMWVTLPALLLLLDYWPLRRWASPPDQVAAASARSDRFSCRLGLWLLVEKIPLVVIAVLAGVWTIHMHPVSTVPSGLDDLAQRLQQAATFIGLFLGKIVWPLASSPGTGAAMPPDPAMVAGVVLGIVLITAWAMIGFRRKPGLAVGWFWYLGTLMPVVGLVRGGSLEVADRFLYFPICGVAILLASVAGGFDAPGRPAHWGWRSAAIVAVAAMVAISVWRLPQWRNTFTLFEPATVRDPGHTVAWNSLGRAEELRHRPQAALTFYDRALEANPNFTDAMVNRGNLLAASGGLAEAISLLERALALEPHNARFRSNLGVILFRAGRREEGIGCMRKALAGDPGLLDTRFNLALALGETGRTDEALTLIRELRRLDPRDASARALEEDLSFRSP